MARIISINVSGDRGGPKTPVEEAQLIADFGIDGDAHGGDGERQISLLAKEDIDRMCASAPTDVHNLLVPGAFAENITTEGIELNRLSLGDRLKLGEEAVVEISKIGKECHDRCQIFKKLGDCIMPKKGIFAQVIEGGKIEVNDKIIPSPHRGEG